MGSVEGLPAPVEAAAGRRPRELRRDSPRRDLRRARSGHGIDLGSVPLGALVGLELEPARAVSRALPVLRGVLHAALFARAWAVAREHLRGLRAVRRRAHPRQLARDPPLAGHHPSDRLQGVRTCARGQPAADLRRLLGGDAGAGRMPVQRRADEQAVGRAAQVVAGAARMTTAERYVTAAYLVVFLVVLAYVLIMATKLARLEREVSELEELARALCASVDGVRKVLAGC